MQALEAVGADVQVYKPDRRYDLDWLRVLAVLLLVPFHCDEGLVRNEASGTENGSHVDWEGTAVELFDEGVYCETQGTTGDRPTYRRFPVPANRIPQLDHEQAGARGQQFWRQNRDVTPGSSPGGYDLSG